MRDSAPSQLPCEASAASSALESLSREQQERLTEILDRYLRELERGVPPRPELLLAQHPDLAEPLSAYLLNLTRLHEMAAAFGQGARGDEEPLTAPHESDVRRLGDFLIAREVGRGGMGVVYEARQISLDRRVALKVLPFAAVLEAQQISRFKNEAQAAAQLHHPNIVPVFAVGAERGVHYYAMQFIDGQPLDRAIAALRADATRLRRGLPARDAAASTSVGDVETQAEPAIVEHSFLSGKWARRQEYFRAVIALGIQAADALHAAHDYGIVHRDIKPSNLLLDGNGKLWITDFGLARCQNDFTLTKTGDVVGTAQYMSPEQASGQTALVDHRTDIYALGATLYELLTLEPANGRGGGSVRRRGDEQEPVRPRLLEPLLPRELETVVEKAMARERDERYLTARQLADDLRRVLEGKPTVARPPTVWDRAIRLARRHRRVVAAAAIVGLLAMIGSTASALLILREKAETLRNFERAERHFREARDAVDRFGSRLAERLAEVPGAEPVRRELLDDTLAYYQRFAEQAADDPALRSDLALTYSKIGSVNDQLGSADKAIAAHQRALELVAALAGEHPERSEYRRRQGVCENNLALALRQAGRSEDAEREVGRAIRLQQALVAEHPDAIQYQADLALSHNNLGLMQSETGATAAARSSFREAIRLQEAVADGEPANFATLSDLAASYNNLAALFAEHEPTEAIELHRKAADYQARAVEARPAELNTKSQWALTLNNLGAALARTGELSDAVASYRRAIEIEKELLRLAPLERGYRRDLAVSYNNLGLAYTRLAQADNAERSFRNALGFQEQLIAENPRDIEIASSLAGACNNLGIVLEEAGRIDEAAANYQKAVDFQRAAQSQATTIDRYRQFLSKHYYNYGRVLRRLGRADEAAQAALARKELWPDDPQRLLSVAEELALASALATENDQSGATANRCAELAIGTLREAVTAGLHVPADLERNEAFAALRGRKEFAAILHP